jgi:hypothetical protein
MPCYIRYDDTERRHELRRIVYSIGEGLLVIALFTAALSAQKATTAVRAEATVVAPPYTQSEGLGARLPEWLKSNSRSILM